MGARAPGVVGKSAVRASPLLWNARAFYLQETDTARWQLAAPAAATCQQRTVSSEPVRVLDVETHQALGEVVRREGTQILGAFADADGMDR